MRQRRILPGELIIDDFVCLRTTLLYIDFGDEVALRLIFHIATCVALEGQYIVRNLIEETHATDGAKLQFRHSL